MTMVTLINLVNNILISVIVILMLNNFVQVEYCNCHVILKPEGGRGALLLGDFNAATDKSILDFHNIKTIVTAAEGMEHLKIDASIKHITYSLLDSKSEKISAFFNESYTFIDENLKRGGVLVHCAAGVSRSATLVIAYLMRKNRFTFKEAISVVKKIRPVVCPNLGFEMQLKEYEKLLNIRTEDVKQIVHKNTFTIMSEPATQQRGSFPTINTLSRTQARPKPNNYSRKQILSRQTRDSKIHSMKNNLMLTTIGYQTALHDRGRKASSERPTAKKEEGVESIAKLMFAKNFYGSKFNPLTTKYEEHVLRIQNRRSQHQKLRR